jgi:hypothetical protein
MTSHIDRADNGARMRKRVRAVQTARGRSIRIRIVGVLRADPASMVATDSHEPDRSPATPSASFELREL